MRRPDRLRRRASLEMGNTYSHELIRVVASNRAFTALRKWIGERLVMHCGL